MSVFGSRSSSIDSLNNSNRNSEDSLPIVDNSNNRVLTLHNPNVTKRRRELSLSEQMSPSPTPESFLRKMDKQYGEYVISLKNIKRR